MNRLFLILLRSSSVMCSPKCSVLLLRMPSYSYLWITNTDGQSSLYIALYSILGCRMLVRHPKYYTIGIVTKSLLLIINQLNVRAAANPWAKYDTELYGLSVHARTDVSTVRFARRENLSGEEESYELHGISPDSTYTSRNISKRNLL